MESLEPVSLKEAEFIVGRPEKEISRAIDRDGIERLIVKVVEPAPRAAKIKKRSKTVPGRKARGAQRVFHRAADATVTRNVRKLAARELLFLTVEKDLREHLAPSGRHKVYEAIKAAGFKGGKISVGPFEIALDNAFTTVCRRHNELMKLRTGIVTTSGGDPVVEGTELSVYLLAALAEGQTADEVLQDYPGLTRQQLERAVAYAAIYPKKGRPYPTRSFKRMLADAAGSGAFDAPEPDNPLTLDMLR